MRSAASFAATIALAMLASPALGHTLHGPQAGFVAGFMHPLLGADHLLAMLAAGTWAAISGGRAFWMIPASFTGTMLAGYALGQTGFPVPGVEPMIAVSVLVLGLAITTERKAAASTSALVIGLFAVFHGAAHGAELPPHAGPFAYAIGFACTSVLLQLCGAALATWSRVGIRVAGVPIAAAGCWMLMQGML